jgi:hypothetical protein
MHANIARITGIYHIACWVPGNGIIIHYLYRLHSYRTNRWLNVHVALAPKLTAQSAVHLSSEFNV